MPRQLTSPRIAAVSVLMLIFLPTASSAQTDVQELGRRFGATPPPEFFAVLRSNPNAFQFSPDNGWVRRGRRVAAVRNRLRGGAGGFEEGVFRTEAASSVNGVMSGDVYMPVFLVLFSNTDSTEIVTNVPREALQTRLYGLDPAPPYSVHSYYKEVSNDSVNVYGTVFDWAFVPGTDATYEGTNNGLSGVGPLMRDAAAVLDDTVDFGQFDNDGPDGIPNSGDDDGRVDAVVMIHPKVDGSCKALNSEAETSIWAHRWHAGPYPTNDVSVATGDFIMLYDYIVQGGQGGDEGCTSDEPQAMGVVAHETGHLFGLPDLYDTVGHGSGIGRWGLMGSGNHRLPYRPAHFSAFSKAQLGWITETRIDSDTTLLMSPVVTSDTAYVLPIPNTNEYFLLENRQPIGSDSMMYREGLLIWHVDSTLVRTRSFYNTVNGSEPYAVALEQADGRDDLADGTNRGDEGDPFPGFTVNRSFGRNTSPSSHSNHGYLSFVELDSIAQAEPFGAIRLKIGFEVPALIAATDTFAAFRLDGEEYRQYDGFLTSGSAHTLDIDSLQISDAGRRRFEWISWTNGQPRSHDFTASSTGDTIFANVSAEYELKAVYSGTGAGTIQSDVPLGLVNGTFLARDSMVTLVATPDSVGHVFEGWYGSDTTATGDTLVLHMGRPFALDARFAAPLVVTDDSLPTATMGTDFQHQLTVSGGVGGGSWALASGPLPPGLAMSATGLVAGVPRQTGVFPLGIEVSSGLQTVIDTLDLAVVAPALAVSDVLQQLVGEGNPLSDEDVVYLDLLGNDNSWLDLGDFLAWVESTGGAMTAEEMTAVLQAVQSAAMERPGAEPSDREGGRRP